MKISTDWLREWVATDLDAQELAHRLTMLGLEVDAVTPVAPDPGPVVVGRVLGVRRHPSADRLSLCEVDVGADAPVAIVCGAANVQSGECYPVALPGATLPGGLKIRRSKIRGEPSEGMLCSTAELGLAETAEGILPLGAGAPPGTSVRDLLGLDDLVIDVDLTPNRADCFSMAGIARDLAAGLGVALTVPDIVAVAAATDRKLAVEVTDPRDCPRFVSRVVTGIDTAARSPLWMMERLRRAGVRPIHPVVDVTNYVMLELGQPMHAYDLQRLEGGLSVRRAVAGESLDLLDGSSAQLDPDVLVIADGAGAVGMAGIMGGTRTAVTAGTRDIVFESAFFSPAAVAGRARRFGLHTDASIRFERGVDPSRQARAVERATALLMQIAGGQAGPVQEVVSAAELPARPAVALRRARLAATLGLPIPDADVAALLGRLGMMVAETPDGWSVTPPAARFDIAIEADLIEEVGRLYGYDRLPETPGTFTESLARVTEAAVPLERARLALVDRGYQEAVTYSFVGGELDAGIAGRASPELGLENPISSALGVMRQSLWPGLLEALRHNLNRQHRRVRLFEAGVVFGVENGEVTERIMLAGVLTGPVAPEQWAEPERSADLFDLKGDLEAVLGLAAGDGFAFEDASHHALRPGRAARVLRHGEAIGWLGELHPALVSRFELPAVPLMFELDALAALASGAPVYRGMSRFPTVRRDLALVLGDTVPVEEVCGEVRRLAGERLRELRLFDVYAGDKVETGSKSVALGLILQDQSRNLTDADAEDIVRSVLNGLSRRFNATIRE